VVVVFPARLLCDAGGIYDSVRRIRRAIGLLVWMYLSAVILIRAQFSAKASLRSRYDLY
jgi:hypothetical protein